MRSVKLPLLKELRESKGWAQETLAELAGISVRTVQRAEKKDSISIDAAMAIAGVMGFDNYRQLAEGAENAVVDHISHDATKARTTPISQQPTNDSVVMSKVDKELLDTIRVRETIVGAGVLLFSVLFFIKTQPDEAAIIGMSLIVGILIVILTKKKEPGKSWWRTWSFNSVNGYVAGAVAATFLFVVSVMLGKSLYKQAFEMSRLASFDHALRATNLIRDKDLFYGISRDVQLKDVLNTEVKEHRQLIEHIESWQQFYETHSNELSADCLVMPASADGKISSLLNFTVEQAKTILDNYKHNCPLSDE